MRYKLFVISLCALLTTACMTGRPRVVDERSAKYTPRFEQLSEREYLHDGYTSVLAIKDTATGQCYILARALEAVALTMSPCGK